MISSSSTGTVISLASRMAASVSNRRIPHNVDAEVAVLGGILLDDGRRLDQLDGLQPADFALTEHRLIFERMLEMRGQVINPVTMKTWAASPAMEAALPAAKGQHEGGADYLRWLADHGCAYPPPYAAVVVEDAKKRELIEIGEGLVSDAYNDTTSADEARLQAISALQEARPISSGHIEPLHDVTPKNVEWLWPDRFVRDGINIVAGMPDVGKNVLLSTVAACVTTGRDWPDGARGCPPGKALISETEDDYASTVVPRLIAAGADMQKCYRIKPGITPSPADLRGFSLFIPSPALSLMHGGKDHNDELDVRAQLAAWVSACREHHCALVAPAHYNKKTDQAALHRLLGSQAFGALPRSVYCIEKDANDPGTKLFLKLKSNLAPDKDGIKFRIDHIGPWTQSIVCAFTGEADVRAEDVVGNCSRIGNVEGTVLTWLREHPSKIGYHYSEIAEATGLTETNCRNKLMTLANKGMIERCGSGTYRHRT